MRSSKSTGTLCFIAALYMFYTAYQLYPGHGTDTSMSPTVSWLFVIFFALAGVFLAVIGWRRYQRGVQEEKEKADENSVK